MSSVPFTAYDADRAQPVPVASPERLISQPAVIASVLLFDAIATTGAGWTASCSWRAAAGYDFNFLAVALIGVGCAVLTILGLRWAYTIRALSSVTRQAVEVAVAHALALAALLIGCVLLDLYSPPLRGWLADWLLMAWSACVAGRFLISALLARWARQGRLARRAVIVGGGESAAELVRRLESAAKASIQILGFFDDRGKSRSPEILGTYQKLGRFADLEAFCREQRVDLLIIALPTTAEERILQILKKLWVLPIDVRIAALGSKLTLRSRAYNYIGDVPFLPVFDKPMSDWSVALKLIEDRTLAGLALLVLSPLMALVALAIKLDSHGPVLFKQIRYGFNNEMIAVYKFRSMYVEQTDAHGAKMVTRDDPRVTRVGRFLRKTSLDELPQLFNVAFWGNLALVGPRPHALHSKAANRLYDEVVDGYFARHRVKPGITGWAQVNGWRGETDTAEKLEQRVAHDLFYIEHWSMLFDLRILLLTPISLITCKNAY